MAATPQLRRPPRCSIMLSPERKGLPVIACRLGAVIAFALMLVVSAQAQTVLHGSELPPGEAIPANGSFSIRFPISYKDVEYQGVETRIGDPKEAASAVHMLTGVDRDGLRFSATEQPLRIPLPPIDSFLETAKRRPDAVASDVQHEQKDGLEILSFSLSEPKQEYFFRVDAQQDVRLRIGCAIPRRVAQQGERYEGRLLQLVQNCPAVKRFRAGSASRLITMRVAAAAAECYERKRIKPGFTP